MTEMLELFQTGRMIKERGLLQGTIWVLLEQAKKTKLIYNIYYNDFLQEHFKHNWDSYLNQNTALTLN